MLLGRARARSVRPGASNVTYRTPPIVATSEPPIRPPSTASLNRDNSLRVRSTAESAYTRLVPGEMSRAYMVIIGRVSHRGWRAHMESDWARGVDIDTPSAAVGPARGGAHP